MPPGPFFHPPWSVSSWEWPLPPQTRPSSSFQTGLETPPRADLSRVREGRYDPSALHYAGDTRMHDPWQVQEKIHFIFINNARSSLLSFKYVHVSVILPAYKIDSEIIETLEVIWRVSNGIWFVPWVMTDINVNYWRQKSIKNGIFCFVAGTNYLDNFVQMLYCEYFWLMKLLCNKGWININYESSPSHSTMSLMAVKYFSSSFSGFVSSYRRKQMPLFSFTATNEVRHQLFLTVWVCVCAHLCTLA